MRCIYPLTPLLVLLISIPAQAEDAPLADIQQRFETRYISFLEPNSQLLLPFEKLESQPWKSLLASGRLQLAFTKSDVFYNNKTYVFSMYRAENGSYYLDAKGGFWGMDELIYGPITPDLLQ
jgi:CMP-N-acetylneuraminic acid synthetase